MSDTITVQQIRAAHPFPWHTIIHPNGLVQVANANNIEVPLFTVTALLEVVTQEFTTQGEPA